MQNYVINNGAFTANGNFSGYTALGIRVHLHKRQMEALEWKANEDIKFPFFCIADTKLIGALNADGSTVVDANGLEIKSERLTALSAFKTKAEITQAHADSKLLDVEIAQAIQTQAKASGLSESALSALANASF
tara:strand:+ start:325 stop:726 length:402 start_codon:yes stop_codon:yes gene_type:complete